MIKDLIFENLRLQHNPLLLLQCQLSGVWCPLSAPEHMTEPSVESLDVGFKEERALRGLPLRAQSMWVWCGVVRGFHWVTAVSSAGWEYLSWVLCFSKSVYILASTYRHWMAFGMPFFHSKLEMVPYHLLSILYYELAVVFSVMFCEYIQFYFYL